MRFYIILIVSCVFFQGCLSDTREVLDYDDQLAYDIAKIDAHLVKNGIVANTHSSGIRYVINLEGSGDAPEMTDNITLKYKGYLLNGKIFDQSTVPVVIHFGEFIEALQIALQLMQEGDKFTIYAPSGLCYGNIKLGSVPANSNMIFEIELIEASAP